MERFANLTPDQIRRTLAGIQGTREYSNLPRQIATILEKRLGVKLQQTRFEDSPQAGSSPDVVYSYHPSGEVLSGLDVEGEHLPVLRASVLGYWAPYAPSGSGPLSFARQRLPLPATLYSDFDRWIRQGGEKIWRDLARVENKVIRDRRGRSISPFDFATTSFAEVSVGFSIDPSRSLDRWWGRIVNEVEKELQPHARDYDSLVWMTGGRGTGYPGELVGVDDIRMGRQEYTGEFCAAIVVMPDAEEQEYEDEDEE